ncbi:MAG TPA: bifunctional riboflavin kinase/FAD synthetase, partial [Candidatus Acidoferrum sp.]|nr:bifunctional riboflavin kinase/FAD synthetase [Candidatus Acidoferrum sp.]
HIAHDLAHAETNERLVKLGYPHVQLSYDGLQFEVQVDSAEADSNERADAQKPRTVVSATQTPRFSTFMSSEAWASRFGTFGHSSVLAIGSFDGIHLGHQAVLRATVERARALKAVPTALTFDPSPRKVLRPETAPLQLSTIAQRLAWFSAQGLEAAVVLPFTLELSRLLPEEFCLQILVRDLRIKAVFVGENFRFGHKQAGDVKRLRELGAEHGFEVVVLPPVVYRGEVVSSTIIRREVAEGDVSHAARLLGRPFVLTGEVVKGTGTGRRFTFPTLNLSAEQGLLPGRGVYITRTCLDGERRSHRSVTNIGMRPTFDGSALSVETHLLDAHLTATPKYMEVRFWNRLRDEKKFSGPEELRVQIARDIESANKFFSRLRRFRSLRNASVSASLS